MTQTIVQYLVEKLAEAGVEDVFGLPGDYNFEIIDAFEQNSKTKWRGCCNELNAAYASDGYARINGLGVCVTTYGVGELSAINGIAGCYAQNVPVVKIVGMPSVQVMFKGEIVHHSLGNGKWDAYLKAYENVTDYAVMITEENAFSGINLALHTALNEKKPVYIGIPKNVAAQPIVKEEVSETKFAKNSPEALDCVIEKLSHAKKPIIMSDWFVYVQDMKQEAENLVNKLQIPSIVTEMGKGTIDESNEYFSGVFAGKLLNPLTCRLFEESDCILALGLVWADFNAGHFTVALDKSKLINITKDTVETEEKIFEISDAKEFVTELTSKAGSLRWEYEKPPIGLKLPVTSEDEKLKCENFFPLLQNFFQENDIVVTDTGLSSLGTIACKIPDNTRMVNQFLYSSIGWALPASLGVCTACAERRLILLIGDGSAQLTIQELSSFYRYGFKPIIFLLNNSGYTIERALSMNPDNVYNDIAPWNWEMFLDAFCADSYYKKVPTVSDLNEAFRDIESLDKPAFVELILDKLDLPIYAKNVYELMKRKQK